MKNNLAQKELISFTEPVQADQNITMEYRSDRMLQHSLPYRINNCLFGELTESRAITLDIYFILISAMEISAYAFHGIFSVIASRIWLLGFFICIAGIITYFIKAIITDLIKKKILSLILIFSLMLFLTVITYDLNLSEINPDAAQQAAAGMSSFRQADLNYTGKAFLGYPNRQYILAALPALLFGRSITALHLGFALPFLMGILIFYCGLRKWAYKLSINTDLAVLPIAALFVFPFVTEYYTNFEQSVYPISFTMMAAGFFLLLLCKPGIVNTYGLAWTGCMLSNTYTPALATLALMLVLTFMTALTLWTKPESMPFAIKSPVMTAKVLLSAEFSMLVFLASTLIDQRQDRITKLRDGNRILLSAKGILDFLTDKNASFMGMLGVIVIIYLIAGITLRLKLWDLLISLWVLGVFAATNLLTGYTAYQPAWIMQRALVVIPVLTAGITLTAFQLIKKKRFKINKNVILILAMTFAFLGVCNFNKPNQSFTYFNHIQPMKYLLWDLEQTVHEKGLDSTSDFNLVIYNDSILMRNAKDYCKFLYPKAKVYNPDNGEFPSDIDTGLDTFIYGSSELSPAVPAVNLGILSVKDAKYDLEIRWYKGSIVN